MDSTTLQENADHGGVRRAYVRDCVLIAITGLSMVIGLALIGATFGYAIHSFEAKNYAQGTVVTTVVVLVFAWALFATYYSLIPRGQCLRGTRSYRDAPILDPLIYSTDGDTDEDTEVVNM